MPLRQFFRKGRKSHALLVQPSKILHRISKIIFVMGSYEYLERLNVNIFKKDSLLRLCCILFNGSEYYALNLKVEKILKGSLNSIPSPSSSVEIQIMSGKVCLRCKGKTLLGIVKKLLKTKSLLTSPSIVLPYFLK